jgi:hypothetical protein
MPSRLLPYSPTGDYQPWHIAATGTLVPVGRCVNTTSATTILAGTNVVVTPVNMANIIPGILLNVANGVGTPENVLVKATTPTTFTADFQYSHSGGYSIISLRGIFLGGFFVNKPGSGETVTLWNGHPSALPVPGVAIAVITPATGLALPYHCACDNGLFYTVAGTVGDYTLTYKDMLPG